MASVFDTVLPWLPDGDPKVPPPTSRILKQYDRYGIHDLYLGYGNDDNPGEVIDPFLVLGVNPTQMGVTDLLGEAISRVNLIDEYTEKRYDLTISCPKTKVIAVEVIVNTRTVLESYNIPGVGDSFRLEVFNNSPEPRFINGFWSFTQQFLDDYTQNTRPELFTKYPVNPLYDYRYYLNVNQFNSFRANHYGNTQALTTFVPGAMLDGDYYLTYTVPVDYSTNPNGIAIDPHPEYVIYTEVARAKVMVNDTYYTGTQAKDKFYHIVKIIESRALRAILATVGEITNI